MKRQEVSRELTLSLASRNFIICCAVAFLIPISACLGFNATRWASVLLRTPDFLVLFLWLASGLGFGSAALKLTACYRHLSVHLRIVTATAIGLGMMSLLLLGLGMCMQLRAPLAWTILLIGWLAGAWARDILKIGPTINAIKTPYRWLMLLCAAALGLACVAALLPPGLLWGDEPNGYDVLEYHLQVPREWYELGRIVPLQHNVFSYFPFNVEMHYMLAMALRGGPWSGMYLAQLMHVSFIALTVLAIYALIAERSKPMAIIAATAIATVPWMGLLAPVAYDEGGLLLWATLAIGLSLRSPDDWRSMVLAGSMAGFACGSKLTAVPVVLIAVPSIHVALGRFKPKALIAAGSFFLAGSLIFSPWLIKNIAWIGNPVFPEETTLLGRGHWSQTQVERWIKANHLPRPDQQNLSGRAAAGWNQVLADWRYGYVLLPLAMVSAAMSWKDRRTTALLLILAVLAVFWLFFTHLQSRFFTLAIPLSALLIGQVPMQRVVPTAALIIVFLSGTAGLLALFDKVSSIDPHLFDILGVEHLNGLTPLADATIPAEARVLLIGDATPFWYEIPTNRLRYRTVFDLDAQPGEMSDEAWESGWATISGQAIRIINAPELRRLRTYWGVPPPSESVMQMSGTTVR